MSDWSSDVWSSDLEVVADRGVLQEAPVVENPGDSAIDSDRFGLLDDQRAVKAAADLLEAPLVRVVPEGAGIGHGELVEEGLARRDRFLGQVWHAVHRVRHAHAVPMTGRLLSSEERRGGKACVRTGKYRGAPYL